MTEIKFGTDGWRAIIADTFTNDNVARVATATAIWVKKHYQHPSVVVGHDCRFGGRMFAHLTARILCQHRVKVFLASDDFVSTPMISLATLKHGASAGVIITASHNPPDYNGFKIKAHFGGPALPSSIKEVEALIPAEAAVLQAYPKALVARVSWLFGGRKACFPEQILAQARAGSEVEAIGDKWSVPTCMGDIARWLECLWQKKEPAHGLLHLCNSGQATWQTFAQETLDSAFQLGLLKQPVIVKGNQLDAFTGFTAKRPRYTPMANQKLATLLGETPRPWQNALRDHLGRSALRL